MGPSVTKTKSSGHISCLEHSTTRVLHCTIVTRAAMLMFPLLLQSIISKQMRQSGHGGRGVPGLVAFYDIRPGDGVGLF